MEMQIDFEDEFPEPFNSLNKFVQAYRYGLTIWLHQKISTLLPCQKYSELSS